MAFLVATTSLPAVYRPNGYARTTTAGTLHARANKPVPFGEYIPLVGMGGGLRKAEDKAKAQCSWGLGFAELGKRLHLCAYCDWNVYDLAR